MEALLEQKLIAGNVALAERVAASAAPIGVGKGTPIIEQGASTNDLYLIIAGSFDIVVNGRVVARRFARDVVGEMAAIQVTQPRSATVVATEASVVCRVTEPQLAELGQLFPQIWRSMAKELARRLEQRNALVSSTRNRIRAFVICSVEALPIGRAVKNHFDHDPFVVRLWTDGVFRASWFPVESLEDELDQSDFAIAIAQPDDVVSTPRASTAATPRDNVIFELGLFIGRLGRKRSFLLEPRGQEVKLPSDLSGITSIGYRYEPQNLATAMGTPCNLIRDIINDLGPNN
jgi:predicted nucleotide-binding protein